MTRRYSKWFTISPANTTSGPAWATYNGVDDRGNPDPVREGSVGTTYPVTMYSRTKLEAPQPPFHTSEGFRVEAALVSSAIEKQLSRQNPKLPKATGKSRSAAKPAGKKSSRGGKKR